MLSLPQVNLQYRNHVLSLRLHRNLLFLSLQTSHISGHRSHENRVPYGQSTDKFFHNPDFDMIIFCDKLRNISDCRKVILKGCNIVLRNSGFEHLEVQTRWSDGSRKRTPMDRRDPVKVFREQIPVLENTEDFIFRHVYKKLCTEGTAFQCSSTKTIKFREIDKNVQKRVLS